MQFLRANTAVDVLIGPFELNTDGDTDQTGLTITQADVRLSKNGQNMAQKNDANACVHDELGYYNCPLDVTDTNEEGNLTIVLHESPALSIRHDCSVLSEAAYDSMFAAKDAGFMDVNIKTIGRADTTETEATNLEAACAAYSVTRGLTGTAVPAAAADASGGLMISDDGGWDADELYDAIVTDAAGTNVAIDIIAVQAAIDALENISVADITGVEVDNDGTAISLAGAFKLILSVLAGKTSGGGTATLVFRDINDAKNRISATVDANGNRTDVGTRDAS